MRKLLLLFIVLTVTLASGCTSTVNSNTQSNNQITTSTKEEIFNQTDTSFNDTLMENDNSTIYEAVQLEINNIGEDMTITASKIKDYYTINLYITAQNLHTQAKIQFELLEPDYELIVNNYKETNAPVILPFKPNTYTIKFKLNDELINPDSVLLQITLLNDNQIIDSQLITVNLKN